MNFFKRESGGKKTPSGGECVTEWVRTQYECQERRLLLQLPGGCVIVCAP